MTSSFSSQVSEPVRPTRILIVEDEYILARDLTEVLTGMGYEVVGIAETGAEAIQKATSLRPTLILMNIRLQGDMDGVTAAETIWRTLQIPVIYVTGHSDQKTVERASLTSPFGYVLKPVRDNELYVVIQTAIVRYQRESFLDSVLQEMNDGVIVVNCELQILYFNPIAQQLTGWSASDAIGASLSQVFKLLDPSNKRPIENPAALSIKAGEALYAANRPALLVTRQNLALPIENSAALLRTNDGEISGAVVVFRDRLDRPRDHVLSEEEIATTELEIQSLSAKLEELQQLNQLKDDFLASTSHQLRTPLTNIKLAICLLETVLSQDDIFSERAEESSRQVARYLKVLRTECEQELKLINDLLFMRSIDAAAYRLELTTVELRHWLLNLAEGFRDRVEENGCWLEIFLPEDVQFIVIDAANLYRVVAELLNNACKYTGIGQRIWVNLAINKVEKTFQIDVNNAGSIIPPDELPRIWDSFYRAPQGDRTKHGGTGLGLSLVRKVIEYMGGTITATSQDNVTSFTLELPLEVLQPANPFL